MNVPHTEITAYYSGKNLTARYYDNYASLTLYDLGTLRFPLVWSRSVTKEQATAALNIFEHTGITLQ